MIPFKDAQQVIEPSTHGFAIGDAVQILTGKRAGNGKTEFNWTHGEVIDILTGGCVVKIDRLGIFPAQFSGVRAVADHA